MLVSACSPAINNNGDLEGKLAEKDTKIATLEAQILELENEIEELNINLGDEGGQQNESLDPMNVLQKSVEAMALIKDKDMAALSQMVHPTKGVRFTAYPFIDTDVDVVLSGQDLSNISTNPTIWHWGYYDGSGEPINMNFDDYYNAFIYDQDFMNPHILGISQPISSGNMINNLSLVYPNNPYVEFHFTGFNPQYVGLDWESLTLVFEEVSGELFLVGVIHGQWTT